MKGVMKNVRSNEKIIPSKTVISYKISVVMPSFLGEYEGAATDREEKLVRAIFSFNNQTHPNRELIIVADGCAKTVEIARKWNVNNDIKIIFSDKQPLFSGLLRHKGVMKAEGHIICYLDSDDVIGKNHLKSINDAFAKDNRLDWVYYNDYIFRGNGQKRLVKLVELEHGSIGTSSIAHKREIYGGWFFGVFGRSKVTWKGCDGYGHDWIFIQKLMAKGMKHKKIVGCDYNICHIPEVYDK
jgi:glycosyltransferase involved in cell wall biosynthesis